MPFPSHIFKAYDIRGLAGSELSDELAYNIGRAFVLLLREEHHDLAGRRLVVGRDMRITSLSYQDAVVRGIIEEGVDVVGIGLSTTPLFNFACAHYSEHAGGIMVTASHNPAEYNGFKLTLDNGLPIGKNSGMSRLYEIVNTLEKKSPGETRGQVFEKSVLPDYLDRIFSLVPKTHMKPLKVVIDFGNGMGSVTFEKLMAALPFEVEYLYKELDGTFPNHESNPLKTETLRDLQARVVATGADFGFALDADADRIGLVDEKGEVVDASFVGALIGLEVLKKHPGAHFLYDLRSSKIADDLWSKAGATTEMCMVGHALIKKMMKETQAAFASELSLHVYFRDMYDVESSDLSFLYLAQLISREQKPLSSLIQPLKKYNHSGEINFEVKNKEEIVKAIEQKYKNEAIKVSYLDGLWMQMPWGWFNVRQSNTEPVLRLNLETGSAEMTREKVGEMREMIVRKA